MSTDGQSSNLSPTIIVSISKNDGSSMCSISNCPAWKSNAKIVDATLCPKCGTSHYPSCANKFPLASNGVFKKCCGLTSPLPDDNSSFISSSASNLRTLLREELDMFRGVFTAEFEKLNTAVTSTEMKNFNLKIDTYTHYKFPILSFV